jgi:hypothetical protein
MSGQEGRGGRGEWEGKELVNDSKVSERITERKGLKEPWTARSKEDRE